LRATLRTAVTGQPNKNLLLTDPGACRQGVTGGDHRCRGRWDGAIVREGGQPHGHAGIRGYPLETMWDTLEIRYARAQRGPERRPTAGVNHRAQRTLADERDLQVYLGDWVEQVTRVLSIMAFALPGIGQGLPNLNTTPAAQGAATVGFALRAANKGENSPFCFTTVANRDGQRWASVHQRGTGRFQEGAQGAGGGSSAKFALGKRGVRPITATVMIS